MNQPADQHRELLARVAREAMIEYGLEPEFPARAIAEAGALPEASADGEGAADLRALLWCSIDNDDSLDLDQLTVAEGEVDGGVRVLVAIADVSATVLPGSAVDAHAGVNTTSVYTPGRIFPMLPDRLSTDLTSLNPAEDRLAVVVGMTVDAGGAVVAEDVRRALVHNHAKLAYPSVGAWLQGEGGMPPALAAVEGLAENLRLQHTVAQRLRARRREQGALDLETLEVKARFDGGAVSGLVVEPRDRAKELIEDFMIAANGVVARYLAGKRFPVVRRVVREPERWQRIVDLADQHGFLLPEEPDAPSLNAFLEEERESDPERFPDLSLAIVKLLGSGEYEATQPGEPIDGHFGLAVTHYAHSTAPNRRYPDLITQRLVKAALDGSPIPYSGERLAELAAHCTHQEDQAQKVERRVRKSAAACFLVERVGDEFDGFVTGASPKGTWVRALDPPVEGRVVEGAGELDVGDAVRVRLVDADPERGFIDFAVIS
ncbi:MAG TPA: RNB domain-containing ribonuclease [Thermoleophilia bacterium]|nr:RNB domain-containing ribonuclease [Thermoleophilia bacterium]